MQTPFFSWAQSCFGIQGAEGRDKTVLPCTCSLLPPSAEFSPFSYQMSNARRSILSEGQPVPPTLHCIAITIVYDALVPTKISTKYPISYPEKENATQQS